MFFGAFSRFHSDFHASFQNHHRKSEGDGVINYQVVKKNFTGGYYLNPILPCSSADSYFYDDENDILVLFSGGIYNRAELTEQYHEAATATDAGLVAVLFQREGRFFIEKLNGDFAIFIGQPAEKEAYLFRDHVGIHPLAWAVDSDTLYFSTDIIGLSRFFSDGQPLDCDYLLGYFKYIDYRKTPVEKVHKLLPGHFIHFTEKGIETKRYWDPGKIRIDKKLSHEQMLSETRALLSDAVKIRCDRRFTAGAHVSSGIDSGIVSALARNEYKHQKVFYGFSWSPRYFIPAEVKYDERDIVASSCAKTDITPLYSVMSTGDFPQVVSDFCFNQGYFSEDKTAEQAADVGVNLIFSGWGGDEFISTGDRGIETDLLRGLQLKAFFRRNPLSKPRQFANSMLRYVIRPALGILEKGTVKSFSDDARYIKKEYRHSDRKAIRDFYFHTSRRQLHLRLLHFYHLQERCESWAMNGFRRGVEYRYPLLDRRIIEYMLKVPSELLCKTDDFRPLLREIGEGILPDEVRLNLQKKDPVYTAYMAELHKSSAVSFMCQVNDWEANPDLYFVNFDLLAKDIAMYREAAGNVEESVLFRSVIYLKAIHEFTRIFRVR